MLRYSRLWLLLLKCADTPRCKVSSASQREWEKDWTVSLHHTKYAGGSTFKTNNRKCFFTL